MLPRGTPSRRAARAGIPRRRAPLSWSPPFAQGPISPISKWDAPGETIGRIGELLHRQGGRLILSLHRADRTPDTPELCELLARGRRLGADLIKIACPVRDARDAARLLSLHTSEAWRGRLLLAGLGRLGGLFRCIALLEGVAFTYAAPDAGPKVLCDQPRAADLWRAFERLEVFQRQRIGDPI